MGSEDAAAALIEAAIDAYRGEYQVDVHINLVNMTRRYIELTKPAPRAYFCGGVPDYAERALCPDCPKRVTVGHTEER